MVTAQLKLSDRDLKQRPDISKSVISPTGRASFFK
jgi:hypothetical protein